MSNMPHMSITRRPSRIAIDATSSVSGLYVEAGEPFACCTLAPGAGAGLTHPFMESVADGLARRRVATLLYQFPFLEAGSRRPDRPSVAHATVRAAVAAASDIAGNLPLFAGGKSFGGRMTSQAQASGPLPGVRGLFFLGFPLHLANKPATERAVHLDQVRVPMMFIQGTRDALADASLMRRTLADLSAETALCEIEGGDHAMHVPKRSGRSDEEALGAALDALAGWMMQVVSRT